MEDITVTKDHNSSKDTERMIWELPPLFEKHLTLSRSDGGVYSEFSMEPTEMKKFVEDCRAAFSSLGSTTFKRSDLELENKIFRRSLYFVKS